jgi:hypothetical protein
MDYEGHEGEESKLFLNTSEIFTNLHGVISQKTITFMYLPEKIPLYVRARRYVYSRPSASDNYTYHPLLQSRLAVVVQTSARGEFIIHSIFCFYAL